MHVYLIHLRINIYIYLHILIIFTDFYWLGIKTKTVTRPWPFKVQFVCKDSPFLRLVYAEQRFLGLNNKFNGTNICIYYVYTAFNPD